MKEVGRRIFFSLLNRFFNKAGRRFRTELFLQCYINCHRMCWWLPIWLGLEGNWIHSQRIDLSNMKQKANYGKNKNIFFFQLLLLNLLYSLYLPMAIVKNKPIVNDGLWQDPPRLFLSFYGTFILVYFLFHNSLKNPMLLFPLWHWRGNKKSEVRISFLLALPQGSVLIFNTWP